jgi:competence protein ComEC
VRKHWIFVLLVLLCFVFTLPVIAAPTVVLDGKQLSFSDTQPIIEDGRTLVPLRSIFESMGATVTWNQDTQTATAIKGNTTVILPIGSTEPTINGQVKKLDVPAKIVNGRTLAPLRFVGEAFGGTVGWDQGSQTITIFSAPPSGTPPPSSVATQAKVHFIDVGQGDAILIQLSSGKNILIDAGTTSTPVIAYLNKSNIKRLDGVIATHPHSDHIGGMADIIKSFDVGSFYMPRVTHTTKTFENMIDAVKDKGLKATEATAGVNIDVGQGFNAYFVAPNSSTYDNLNNYSAVLKLEHGKTAFLFTGDAEDVSESEMLRHNLQANLLKVGHHGSDTSTTASFLNVVQPQFAVICVGSDNTYGHPTPEVLARLQATGAKIYRTDEQGTIIATSNGNTISLNTAPSTTKVSSPITPSIETPPPAEISAKYIGNKNSKKFHLPTCKTLPSQANQINFNSRDEAINRGYTPCGNCKP